LHTQLFSELSLRLLRPEDAKQLTAIANNKAIWKNLMDGFPHPYTLKDAKKWIHFCLNESANIHRAITLNQKVIGAIGAQFGEDIYRYNAELGYWLAESQWGKGIMTYIIGEFTKYVFENHKIHRLYAKVFKENIASHKTLEKNGFILEGTLRKGAFKNGYFMDVHVYSKLKEDH
jgi:ribosomal-protein-alanine N-acetyltransferase